MCATAAAAPMFAGAGAAAVEAAAAAISAAIAGTSSQRQQQQQPPCPPGAAAADCSSSRSFYKALMETGGVLRPPVGPPIPLNVDFAAEIQPHLGKLLGRGGFGAVYEATWRGKKVGMGSGRGCASVISGGGFCSEGVVCTLCALCMVRVWTLRQRSSLT